MARRHRIFVCSAGIILCVVLGGLGLATTPVVVKQGVNFQVSTQRLSLYVKALDFLHRHIQDARLAQDITHGLTSDRARVLAVFAWTRRHIRKTPADWPIVDDHILNIVIRGHGLDDQMADVFTTLSTYAGVPAFWRFLNDPSSEKRLVLSFAHIGDTWAIFDVWNGVMLTDAHGDFLTAEDVVANPHAVVFTGGAASLVPYERYLTQVRGERFVVPVPLRAELQQPWPRLRYELARAIGRWGGQ